MSAGIGRILLPSFVLVAVSLAIVASLDRASGGKEIADDVASLSKMVREPFVLWGDYRAAGLSDNWGSFPPLFPPLFSILVAPFMLIAGDFWGFRLGVLCWAVVALVVLDALLVRNRIPAERRMALEFLFVLLPSLMVTIAVIPEEEIFVSLFVAALFSAGASARWNLVTILFLVSTLAGKYFLLVLVPVLAVWSPSPLRNATIWFGLPLAALAAYAEYHKFSHGIMPIVSHDVNLGSYVSFWALAWNLGLRAPQNLAKILSALLAAAFAVILASRARVSRRPLAMVFSGTMVGSVMLISISAPGYILWGAPIYPVAVGLMEKKVHRLATALLLVLWGLGELGANFFRGVSLALAVDRPEGEERIASVAERLLGSHFPFSAAHIGFLFLVLACGCALVYLFSMAPALEDYGSKDLGVVARSNDGSSDRGL